MHASGMLMFNGCEYLSYLFLIDMLYMYDLIICGKKKMLMIQASLIINFALLLCIMFSILLG